ncbi:DMT family transporter [Rhizobium sp. KVB221]|uniref:DMT family transporter n=1 Tax=Rhizobium setariae TaxID=2801340 RepID=A0A937CQL6_9HYPH|nr:DMT family transporter [Rhizobium setariae]MBL0373177.1 DMT family transporter [Rhizobium setariae]
MDPRRDYQLGLFFVMAAAITWSSAGFFTRLIDLDYPTMIAGRGIFGALGLFIVIVIMNGRKWPRLFITMGRNEAIYIALVVLGMIAFIGSLGLTSVAHNAVIFATIPLISAFLGWFFLREIPSQTVLVASAVAILGVAIMMGFGFDGGLSGDILSFVATLCMALSIIIIRLNPTIAITACACVGSLVSGLVCLPFADLSAVTPTHFGYLVLFGLLNSAAGLTLFSLGSRRLPAVETALISTLDTPLSPLWVWLAFGETAGPQTLVGGGIVLGAVVMHVVISQRRQARAAI